MNYKKGKEIKCIECLELFYVSKSGFNRIYCSIKCSSKASKTKRLGENNPAWKGNNGLYAYTNIHKAIRKIKGKPLFCANNNCSNKSNSFQWANIYGNYDRNPQNYLSLCRSCHINFDRYKKDLTINGKVIKKQNKKILFNDYIKTHATNSN